MNRSLGALALVVAGGSLSSCAPYALLGEACVEAPCAPGLVCDVSLVCTEPPPPPPPPCESDSDCAVDGDASGRVCDEGVCRFDDCVIDAQCGTRICVGGTCAPAIPCVRDDDCDGGALCEDNACRPPCLTDENCGLAVGGFGLQSCVDGRCLQRCFGDATCLTGGVCEENVCVTPECEANDDCGGEDDPQLCNAGRCESFTPCAADADCFDPNFFCDVDAEPVRCAERPSCRNDAACGFEALCLDRHCRPATSCGVADDCGAGEECLGGRCVRAPECRSETDCDAAERCVALRCQAEPGRATAPALLMVGDDVGVCEDGACERVLFVGEQLTLRAQSYDAARAPIDTTVAASSAADAVASATASAARATVRALAAGVTVVTITVEGVTATVTVRVVAPAATDELAVVVVDHTGALVADATVDVDDGAAPRAAGSDGVVRVSPLPAALAVSARATDGRGVSVIGAPPSSPTSLRLPLPTPPLAAGAAVARVTVTSTGDELGPVGLGLIIPSVSTPAELHESRLLGDAVASTLEVPLIGGVPFVVPAGMTLEATLQIGGTQVPRAVAEAVVSPGPSFVLAIEDRREQDAVIGLVLGADPLGFARELLGDAETADTAIVALGQAEVRPLVADAADRDGDGNVTELVPDFGAVEPVDARPGISPTERGSVVATPLDDAVTTIVWVGFAVPGALVPAGASLLRGLVNFEGVPLAESYRSAPAPLGLARAQRALAVTATFDDDALRSRAIVFGDALPREAAFGALLAPPTGVRLIDDLPAPGERTALLPTPAGDLVRLTLSDEDGAVDVYAAPGGSLRLPAAAARGATRVEQVSVYVAGGLLRLQAGAGPVTIDAVATKAASAPGG